MSRRPTSHSRNRRVMRPIKFIVDTTPDALLTPSTDPDLARGPGFLLRFANDVDFSECIAGQPIGLVVTPPLGTPEIYNVFSPLHTDGIREISTVSATPPMSLIPGTWTFDLIIPATREFWRATFPDCDFTPVQSPGYVWGGTHWTIVV